jgi:hypothetical protein
MARDGGETATRPEAALGEAMTGRHGKVYHMYSKEPPYYGPVPVVDPPWYFTECGLLRKNDDCAPADNVTCGSCKKTKRYRAYKAQMAIYEEAVRKAEMAMER